MRLKLPQPARNERRFWQSQQVLKRYRAEREIPSWERRRPEPVATQAWEQECRSCSRALLFVSKAKLEAVETGITTFDREFLAHFSPAARGRRST